MKDNKRRLPRWVKELAVEALETRTQHARADALHAEAVVRRAQEKLEKKVMQAQTVEENEVAHKRLLDDMCEEIVCEVDN